MRGRGAALGVLLAAIGVGDGGLGRAEAQAAAATVSQRFGVKVEGAVLADDASARRALEGAVALFTCGTAGAQVVSQAVWTDISSLKLIADINAGRGTLGKLIRDEQIYNDARAAIARFNTTAERIDGMVAAAQRGEGTVGKLLQDETLYTNVNQLSSEGVKMLYDFRQNPRKYLTVKFELF